METILTKAFSFIFIIILAYTLKKLKIFKREDGLIVSQIVMKVTLPCALISGFSGVNLTATMIIVFLVGLISNLIMCMAGKFIGRKDEVHVKANYILNCAGYNIGNFTIPFCQSFFPSLGLAYIVMFDIGNALVCLGGSNAIAQNEIKKSAHFDFKGLIRSLSMSIAFDTYVILIILSLLNITIPAPMLSVISTIGQANTFLAMFMIGLLLEINIDRKDYKIVSKILFARYFFGAIFIGIIWLIPLPILVKQVLSLSVLAPPSTITAAFSEMNHCDSKITAMVSSISMPISIILMTILLTLFL